MKLVRFLIYGMLAVAGLKAATSPATRLVNISTRAHVDTGSNIEIAGFAVGGTGSVTLLIRAVGPGLAQFQVTGILARPSLALMSGGSLIASNTGWSNNQNASQIAAAGLQVGAFPLASGSADSALLVTLQPGLYTALVSGVGNTTGVALAEIYEVASTGGRLVNVSTRAQVGTGSGILIPGFVISGNGTERLLVRAIGPALSQFGVTGALLRPTLSVFNGSGQMVASNTGWSNHSNPSLILQTGSLVGAFPLANGSADSATIVELPPGANTVQISGVNGTTGIALAEIYEVASIPPVTTATVTLNTPARGATQLSGRTFNVDPARTKVVIYVLTNQWYVQPFSATPFTNIAADGTWSSFTHPWNSIVVLLVDPATYRPAATSISNPALGAGVIAWTSYPAIRASVDWSGRQWGIKVTGEGNRFDPGPNYWSNDPAVVSVGNDGLRLKITRVNGSWQCAEVSLNQSLGYGIYTVQINSRLDQLDRNVVAAPLFIYADTNNELDNEYSGRDGLIPGPNNAQFVAQPYTVPGNIMRYTQPPTSQFTSQIEWRENQVTFTTWSGWSSTPSANDIIRRWTYTGRNIPRPGLERVHINLWLLNGRAPTNGQDTEMIIRSFSYQP